MKQVARNLTCRVNHVIDEKGGSLGVMASRLASIPALWRWNDKRVEANHSLFKPEIQRHFFKLSYSRLILQAQPKKTNPKKLNQKVELQNSHSLSSLFNFIVTRLVISFG